MEDLRTCDGDGGDGDDGGGWEYDFAGLAVRGATATAFRHNRNTRGCPPQYIILQWGVRGERHVRLDDRSDENDLGGDTGQQRRI